MAQSPRWPDHERLAAVRADLTRMPLVGERARKVWARLRIQDDIRVSRARVSPLMREHGLLSPHRQPQKPLNAHDGRMTTNRPNERWGADGAKVQTVDEGLVWIFAAVDHCDAACVGIHVTKVGDRFAALEPISQGVREQFGSVEADAGRGLSLRMDHGPQYRSDDFRAQLKFWGMTPSYAFVAEPQTHGVAERFNRTNNVEEVRAAAVAFKDRYNREWRLEKLGFKTPLEARQAPLFPLAA
ncbi:MAG: DDE-type integrase/transposase/recombinase [Burkholderia sp.]